MQRPVKAKFWLVTGEDYGRAIKWARNTPNSVSQQIKAAVDAMRSGKRP